MGCAGSKGRHGALKGGADDGINKDHAWRLANGEKLKKAKKIHGEDINGGVVQAVRHGKAGCGGIVAYIPDEETLKTYQEYLRSLRRIALAGGILPAVAGDCPPVGDAVCDKESDTAKGKVLGSSALGSSTSNGIMTCSEDVGASPQVQTTTVYQLQPLPGDTEVATGMYSKLHLARLSVFTSASGEALNATVPRHMPSRRRKLNSLASHADVANLSSSISAETGSANTLSSSSVTTGVVSIHNTDQNGESVGASTAKLDTSPAGEHTLHYIVAMKEIPLRPGNATSAVLEQVCLEVRKWARISAYCTRFLRCYQLEFVSAEGVSTPVLEASCHLFPKPITDDLVDSVIRTTADISTPSATRHLENRKKMPSHRTSSGFPSRSNHLPNASARSAESVMCDGAPQKLRLYLEYAKYGNMREYQMFEMQEQFGRRRLHELTARAYMRDVLVALLHLHEIGELQHDLCAEEIFLHKPIMGVYRTYFPAYISDLPTGDLTSVSLAQLGRSLGFLGRAPPSPLPAPPLTLLRTDDRGSPRRGSPSKKLSDSINSAPLKQRRSSVRRQQSAISFPPQIPGNSATFGACHTRGVSMLVHDSSMPMLEASYGQSIFLLRPQNNDNNNISEEKREAAIAVTGKQHHRTIEEKQRVEADCNNATASGSTSVPHSLRLPLKATPKRGGGPRGGRAKRTERAAHHMGSPSLKSKKRSSRMCLPAVSTHEVSGRGKYSDDQRLHDTYRRFMDEFGFKRSDSGGSAPFPSPHDGVRGQADAEMLASTMMPRESCRLPQIQLMPLQRSGLGGIAVLSPDPYVVRSVDAQLPDVRGRVPMLLTSPSPVVLREDLGHRRQATYGVRSSEVSTSVDNSAIQPLATTQTLSSGMSTINAIGSLGRSRGNAPLVKLNHSFMIHRTLAMADSEQLEDQPLRKYITVTHAAPEVLRHSLFSPASDIYAFAMTFLELVSDNGLVLKDCLSKDSLQSVTRHEKAVHNDRLADHIDKWYQTSNRTLLQNMDAMREEQEPPRSVSPHPGPIVVPLPPYLSDECKSMLRWCLQSDPTKRPTAAELLRCRYFMLGDWIAAPSAVAAEGKRVRAPEAPWIPSIGFDEAARAIGLPELRAK